MSVFVTTPAKKPAELQTITRSDPERRSPAAWISGASSAIVTEPFARLGQQLFDEHRFCPPAVSSSDASTLQSASAFTIASALSASLDTFLFEGPSSLLAAERHAKGGHDARSGERETAKTHRDDGGELGSGVDVILDHDLQAERSVMEQGDQKQDHQGGGERRPQPGDEGGVIAAAMHDDLGREPNRQRHKRDG